MEVYGIVKTYKDVTMGDRRSEVL